MMWPKAMMVMVVMAVMVTLVPPVSPRPHQHQTKEGGVKIESAMSESLKDIEAAILGSARKIESAIQETIAEKVSEMGAGTEERDTAMLQTGAAYMDVSNKRMAFRKVLAKILARRASASSAMGAAAPAAVPGINSRDADVTTTTTMDPLDEYCKEACQAGVGGPECNCPEPPIG